MIGKLTTGKFAGLLTGLGVTAVIQSSSATTVMVVGFVNSRLMTLKQAIHVIMGANIGTIATAHSVFNITCTLLLLPMSGLLEKLAYKFIPDNEQIEKVSELDERLLATPAIALECAHKLTFDMAKIATDALVNSINCLSIYDKSKAEIIREAEDKTDYLEDVIGSYLVKLSAKQLNEGEGATASMLLKAIGDFERISDHVVNILESSEEMREKDITFSNKAQVEMESLANATLEIVDISYSAFVNGDVDSAFFVEPLEQVIDRMKELLRTRHIERLRAGDCGIEVGFVWNDLITNFERVSDHCSNIAGCVIDLKDNNLNLYKSLKLLKSDNEFYREKYNEYSQKYLSAI